jgi:hypothetical protein
MTRAPMPAQTQRAQPIRHDRDMAAKRMSAAPRKHSDQTRRGSLTPIIGGWVSSQMPSAILAKWAQRPALCSPR